MKARLRVSSVHEGRDRTVESTSPDSLPVP
jgi:hypothetical protein